MARPVGDADRASSTHGIELGCGRMALFSHLLGAIAHPDNPVSFGHLGRMRFQAGEQLGDVLDSGEIGIKHRMRRVDQMAV